MLKTITVYRLIGALTQEALTFELEGVLTATGPTIEDPLKTQWASHGFSVLPGTDGKTIFVGADNTVVFNVQVRERVLPGKVIKLRMLEVAEEDRRRQGYKPNRKQMAEIKERVTMELLPTSHVKPTDVLCMVTGGNLLIGTSNARLVDGVLGLLQYTFPDAELKFEMLSARREPTSSFMHDLLINEATNSGTFNCGDSVILKGANKSTARFKNMGLQADAINDRLTAGMKPVEIGVEYGEDIHFTLTESMVIKSLKFADIHLKEAEQQEDMFDCPVAIVSGLLRRLINALCAEIPVKTEGDDEDNEL